MKKRLFLVLALLLTLSAVACDHKAASGLPVTPIQIGPERFDIEIAISYHDDVVGLMHRDHLDTDHGMIFISPKAKIQSFWNHDVHFPLDLLFLGSNGTIVSIKHMEAYSEKTTLSDAPAQYVIEVLGGTVDRLKLKIGDSIALPKDVLTPVVQSTTQ
jgi:uncharacterized protein